MDCCSVEAIQRPPPGARRTKQRRFVPDLDRAPTRPGTSARTCTLQRGPRGRPSANAGRSLAVGRDALGPQRLAHLAAPSPQPRDREPARASEYAGFARRRQRHRPHAPARLPRLAAGERDAFGDASRASATDSRKTARCSLPRTAPSGARSLCPIQRHLPARAARLPRAGRRRTRRCNSPDRGTRPRGHASKALRLAKSRSAHAGQGTQQRAAFPGAFAQPRERTAASSEMRPHAQRDFRGRLVANVGAPRETFRTAGARGGAPGAKQRSSGRHFLGVFAHPRDRAPARASEYARLDRAQRYRPAVAARLPRPAVGEPGELARRCHRAARSHGPCPERTVGGLPLRLRPQPQDRGPANRPALPAAPSAIRPSAQRSFRGLAASECDAARGWTRQAAVSVLRNPAAPVVDRARNAAAGSIPLPLRSMARDGAPARPSDRGRPARRFQRHLHGTAQRGTAAFRRAFAQPHDRAAVSSAIRAANAQEGIRLSESCHLDAPTPYDHGPTSSTTKLRHGCVSLVSVATFICGERPSAPKICGETPANDVAIPVFTQEDATDRRNPAIERAMTILTAPGSTDSARQGGLI